MNNPVPFFNPFMNNQNNINFEKINNKLTRLEKDIRVIENRLDMIENKEKKLVKQDEPTDMYMI